MSTHPFLTAAETRLAHLREIDRQMTALALREVRLADVQREIPELEAAMTVYRRLSEGGAAAGAPRPTKPSPTPRSATPARGGAATATGSTARRTRRAPSPPSFKEFALNQLDTLAQEADEPTAPPPPRHATALA